MKRSHYSTAAALVGAAAMALVGIDAMADTQEEVRKAAERAVGGAVSGILGDTIKEIIVPVEGSAPSNTVWARPGYTEVTLSGTFDAGTDDAMNFSASSEVAQFSFGGVARIDRDLFLNLALAYSNIETDPGEAADETNDRMYYSSIGADWVFSNTERAKAWLGVTGIWSVYDLDNDTSGAGIDDKINSYGVRTSLTGTYTDPQGYMMSGGVELSAMDSDMEDSPSNWGSAATASVRWLGKQWQPQLGFRYDVAFQENGEDDQANVLSISPEINYKVDNMTFGVGYSKSIQDTDDIDVTSDSVFANFRMLF